MPVSDKEKLLRDGSTDLTTTGNGTGVLVGPGPIGGMKVYVHFDSVTGTSPTLDLHIEESDTLGSGYADVPGGGAFTQFSGTKATPTYDEIHIHWTKKYLRYAATVGGTGSPTYVKCLIALTPGEIPTT